MRRPAAAAAALLLAVPVLLLGSPAARADEEPKKLFTMADERITESSGLARSAGHEGIWWTVNDSSDSARVFAVNADGEVEATLTFGADARDVEAIAVGTDGNIYVADIGDNLRDQEKVTVYVIKEPEDLSDQQVKYRAYDFDYPDGSHNAEALLVEPKTNRLFIVTKEGTGAAIYSLGKGVAPSRREANKLSRMGTAPSIVTDGTFTPDGRWMILRDPTAMSVWSWPGAKTKLSTRLPLQPLGESIAMGPDDKSVLIGSEGRNSAVYQVTIPTTKAATPATPTPQSASGSGATDSDKSHTMRWTLIGAGGFAALMAMFTFPKGRRERADAMLEGQRTRSTM
ncbi:MAG: hypothetical protein ACRDP9_22155 [Kribbellaceae bacterium]